MLKQIPGVEDFSARANQMSHPVARAASADGASVAA
jgi:hypothetical protein